MPLKPYKHKKEEPSIRGEIKDYKKGEWFTFEIIPNERDPRKKSGKIVKRTQKVTKDEYNYFQSPKFKQLAIRIIYLNKESAYGLYKDPENNLPYEIRSIGDTLLYRQSIVERKEDIFNRLEKLAVEEGLRK